MNSSDLNRNTANPDYAFLHTSPILCVATVHVFDLQFAVSSITFLVQRSFVYLIKGLLCNLLVQGTLNTCGAIIYTVSACAE